MNSIEEILIRDKFVNLEQTAEILKSEVEVIAKNFFLLKDDIVVRFKRENNAFVFNVEICAQRIKPFGSRII